MRRYLPALLSVSLLAACARPAPPAADARQRAFPDLSGRAIMLLPVQAALPAVSPPPTAAPDAAPSLLSEEMRRALEAELAYWLPQHARGARWVLPETVERAVRQSPALDARPRELTVRGFQRARLEYIGDPLYTELRRIAALMDTRFALLPVGAVWIPEREGGGRIHLAAALIDTFGGDVLWYGVVAGAPAARDDTAATASVAQALIRYMPQ